MAGVQAMSAAARKEAFLRQFFAKQAARYGWTPGKVREEWEAVFRAQGGKCAICRRPFRLQIGGSGNGRMPATDHNHLTGEIRGLLCGGSLDPKTCNRMIGFHKDNPQVFRNAAEYLETPPARAVLLELRRGVER